MATAPAPAAPIIYTPPKQRTWVDYLFIGIFAVGAFFLGRKIYRDWRGKRGAGKLDDPAHQAAAIIYDAKGFWSDDEQAAIDAAKKVAQLGVDWKDVSKAFSELYDGKNIDEYMNSFMDTEQRTRFFNTMNLTQSTVVDPKTNKPAPIKSQYSWDAGKAVITTADANIRKTAKYTKSGGQMIKDIYNPLTYFKSSTYSSNTWKSNIIAVAPKDRVVGIATGRTSFDSAAEPSGILFVEMKVSVIDTKTNKVTGTQLCWIAASQAQPKWFKEIMTYAPGATTGTLNSPYKTWGITQASYDAAASVSGFGSADRPNYNIEIVAKEEVDIYNGRGEKKMKAKKGIILGHPILWAQDGNKPAMLNFQTISGYNWWVEKSKVKEVHL